jgi:hypothetical protein
MGNQQDELAAMTLREADQKQKDALLDLYESLALRRTPIIASITASHVSAAGKVGVDLSAVEPLIIPIEPLAQLRGGYNGKAMGLGNDPGRLGRTARIAGVRRCEAIILKLGGGRQGLGSSSFRERAVQPPLPAASGIPFGLPVADHDETGHVSVLRTGFRRQCG